jgi:hypothetical protein
VGLWEGGGGVSIELFLLATLIGGAASIVFGHVFSALPNPYKDYCQRWEALNAKNQETIEKLFGALEERNEQCNAWRECAKKLAQAVWQESPSLRIGSARHSALIEFERLKEGGK